MGWGVDEGMAEPNMQWPSLPPTWGRLGGGVDEGPLVAGGARGRAGRLPDRRGARAAARGGRAVHGRARRPRVPEGEPLAQPAARRGGAARGVRRVDGPA